MIKNKPSSHIPISAALVNLISESFLPERPADSELMEIEHEIHLKYQSDDESIFEESLLNIRTKKASKALLSQQIQNLKKQNGVLTRKNQDLSSKNQELSLSLKEKQIQYKHNIASINDLSVSLKASDKRKSILQLELSKLYNQLQSHRSDTQNYQKQINRLLSLNTSKDSQLIDLMHRNSEQIKQLKQNNRQTITQYEIKQEQTKKLLKKLNSINQQKEDKFKQEINSYANNCDRLSAQLKQKQQLIYKCQQDNEIFQVYIKNNTNKYEEDLVNIRNESNKIIEQLKSTQQTQLHQLREEYEDDIKSLKQSIAKLKGEIQILEVEYKERIEEKEAELDNKTNLYYKKQKQYQSYITEKEREIDRLVLENNKARGSLEKQQYNSSEMIMKNQLLQTSLKQLYDTTSNLQAKILQYNKQKTSLTHQNQSFKKQIEQLKRTKSTLEKKLSTNQQILTQIQQKYKQISQISSKLQNQATYYKKNLQVLESQYQQLNQAHSASKKSSTQLQDLLMQHQSNSQLLKDKCIKLQIFIDNYKVNSEKNREKADKRWAELRDIYQKQLQELEQKVIESERKYNALKMKLEKSQRQNKIYEFENNVSPNIAIENTVYLKK